MVAPTPESKSEELEPLKVAPAPASESEEPEPSKGASTLEFEFEESEPPKVAPTPESESEEPKPPKVAPTPEFEEPEPPTIATQLKKKYETNVAKGKKYNTVNPHQLKVFDLYKKVWGSNEGSIEVSAGWRELGLVEGGLELIRDPKLIELKEQQKKLRVAEFELLVRWGELMREQVKLVGRRGELTREHAKLVRKG
ncbi:unnamed protein product [Prunus armeniaca]|uniref:Uncharacterized protein n=1 Tax=Prunus armeniaca TaxID=36596 RepID=A0A6J5XR30_PRUAR|nr:unnamed protein product [Prunus armeniaca]